MHGNSKAIHPKILLLGHSYLLVYKIVIMRSGAFKSLWWEQDGDLTFLHKIQLSFFFIYMYKMVNKECASLCFCFFFMKVM